MGRRCKRGPLKIRFSPAEIDMINEARGITEPGLWARAAVLLAIRRGLNRLPPSGLPNDPHTIEIGFRATDTVLAEIDKASAGFPRGAWLRAATMRVAKAVVSGNKAVIADLIPVGALELPTDPDLDLDPVLP